MWIGSIVGRSRLSALALTSRAFPDAADDFSQRIGGTILQATVGGIVSVAGGGKFENGAVTGAFQYLATASLESVQNDVDPRLEALAMGPEDALPAVGPVIATAEAIANLATATPAGDENDSPFDQRQSAARLADTLRQQSAASPFTPDGYLTDEAIAASREIIPAGQVANPNVPSGFSKYATPTFQSPSGDFQVHFYYNGATGQPFYGLDYKVKFN